MALAVGVHMDDRYVEPATHVRQPVHTVLAVGVHVEDRYVEPATHVWQPVHKALAVGVHVADRYVEPATHVWQVLQVMCSHNCVRRTGEKEVKGRESSNAGQDGTSSSNTKTTADDSGTMVQLRSIAIRDCRVSQRRQILSETDAFEGWVKRRRQTYKHVSRCGLPW